MTRRDLQSLLGKLLCIARCVKGARIFLNRILQVYREKQHCKHIILTFDFYGDLFWFIRFLYTFNGVQSFSPAKVQQTVFVDATLSHVGAIWGSRAYSLPLPDLVLGLPITQCEMFNIVVCLHVWGENWRNKVISVRCDNGSAVYVCNSGKTKDMFLNLCLHMIWFYTAKFNIDLRVSHIAGSLNNVVDALSRSRFEGLDEIQWDVVSPQALSSICRFEPYFKNIVGRGFEASSTGATTSHEKSVSETT